MRAVDYLVEAAAILWHHGTPDGDCTQEGNQALRAVHAAYDALVPGGDLATAVRAHEDVPAAEAPSHAPLEPAPHAPYEVRVSISAETWPAAMRALGDIAMHAEEHGPECSRMGGGGGASESVTVTRRNVAPEQYRAEVDEWLRRRRAGRG